MKSRKRKSNDVVFIVLDGYEYKVTDKNDAILTLITSTDASLPKGKKLNMLDIKGLGLLKYRSRQIVRRKDKNRALVYRLKFEQWSKI